MALIEFFFDVASPYTYLCATQIDALADRVGAEVRWRPFLLGGVFKSVGNRPPADIPERARYMLVDLSRWAKKYDIPYRFPSFFPPNTLLTQRVLTAALRRDGHDAMRRLAKRVFRAYWAEDALVWDPKVLVTLTDATDLPGQELLAMAADPVVKGALLDSSEEAVKRGAFGAPTLFVGDQMFFGNDRLVLLEEHLAP